MITDVALLINPAARRGRAGGAAREFAAELRRAGVTVRELVGSGPVESARFAATAVREGCGALVACGGDGIVHVALQAVAGTAVPFGVMAAGAGNDFARATGLPLADASSAAAVVLDGHVRSVDLARAGERWFGTVLAAGFDSLVADRMNRMRWPSGALRYHAAIVAELAMFRPLPFVLEVDGVRRELEAMLVAVGNGDSYGGGMRICPAAVLDDGLLDVTVVTRISPGQAGPAAPDRVPGPARAAAGGADVPVLVGVAVLPRCDGVRGWGVRRDVAGVVRGGAGGVAGAGAKMAALTRGEGVARV